MTPPSIDPSKIIWIKSVDRGDTSLWAYCGEDPTTRHFEPEREGKEFDRTGQRGCGGTFRALSAVTSSV